MECSKPLRLQETADFTTTVMGGLPVGVVVDSFTGAKPWRQHIYGEKQHDN